MQAPAFENLALASTDAPETLTPIQTLPLPNSRHSEPGRGFTVTGLAQLPDGTVWAGNDGRIRENDGSGYRPTLVRLDSTLARVIEEVPLDFNSSVQGLALVRGRMWFALPSEQAIASIALREPRDLRIELRLDYRPNGLAYDPVRDVLLVGSEVEKTLSSYRRSDGTMLSTHKLADAPDQLLMTRSGLLMATGPNRHPGHLLLLDKNGRVTRRWVLEGAESVEGILLRGKTMLIASDAYYHLSSPGANILLRYTRPQAIRP